MKSPTFLSLIITVSTSILYLSCSNSSGSDGSGYQHPVLALVGEQAQKFSVPERMILSAALYESRFNPNPSSLNYLDLSTAQRKSLGFQNAENAFGISDKTLGLNPNSNFKSQVKAYVKWLSTQVKDLGLAQDPQTPDEVFQWISTLARLHRPSSGAYLQNQVIWSKGFLEVYNSDALIRSPNSDDFLELAFPPKIIRSSDFSALGQEYFANRPGFGARLAGAVKINLAVEPSFIKNSPNYIRVIHCPMNLSACLAAQESTDDNSDFAQLKAHYVIGSSEAESSNDIIEVLSPEYAVSATDYNGQKKVVDDAVVIMLTGISGRYTGDGLRTGANLFWFTADQLARLGETVRNVCYYLANENENFSTSRCMQSLPKRKRCTFPTSIANSAVL